MKLKGSLGVNASACIYLKLIVGNSDPFYLIRA